MFDATGTTIATAGVNAFHQVRYEFSFGDDRGQTWPISGQPKNIQRGGPLAAHVFDQPGTYTVRVRATAPNGAYSDSTVSITVQSADAAYSGAKTVCVSTSANYAGCPAGAVQQTALPTEYSGKRVLLRRGETFGQVSVRYEDDNVQVGGFGSGTAKPRVNRVTVGSGMTPTSGNFPDDITVMDLDIANGIGHTGPGSRLFFYRNDLDDASATANNSIEVGAAIGYFANQDPNRKVPADQYYNAHEIFVVENRVIGSTENDTVPRGNFYGSGSRMAFLGNDMGSAFQHTVRLFSAHKTVMQHNAIRGRSSDGIRHALKIHSGGLGAYNDNYAISGGTWASSQIVLANNLFGDPQDNNAWTVAIRPQNAGADSGEGIEDVILENNRFVRGLATNTDLLLVGRRLETRGNTRADGGSLAITADNTPYPSLPADWRGPYTLQ
jgi:hypothetical protein